MSDSPLLFMRRNGILLEPSARFDQELITRWREGVRLRVQITEPRSHSQNRFYWAVLQAVCDATGRWPNSEVLHHALKLHLGFIEEFPTVTGEVGIRAQSAAFHRMDAAKFREYLDSALEVITTEICPGLTLGDLLALGNARLGPDERRAA